MNLICPKCGEFQGNDKLLRQAGVGLKNAGKFAAKNGIKFLAKDVGASMIDGVFGGGGQYFKRGIGKGVDNLLNQTSLGKMQSLNSVQYKCCSCGCYWDGFDCYSRFNKLQKDVVRVNHEYSIEEKRVLFVSALKYFALWLVLFGTTYYLYTLRSITTTIEHSWLFGDVENNDYSWHYYVCWPLFVVFGYCALFCFVQTIREFSNYSSMKGMDHKEYSEQYMGLC